MKYTLLFLMIFFSNAIIMVFEIIWIRILSPFIGGSIVTWGTIIGIILFSLSLWNYYGGKFADRWYGVLYLKNLFLLASLLLFFLFFCNTVILEYLSSHIKNLEMYVLISATILFWPVSYLLWIVSPIVMKILIHDIHQSGLMVGIASGVGALWGIIGTIISGFVLIPYLGIHSIVFFLSFLSFFLSFLVALSSWNTVRLFEKYIYIPGFFVYIYILIIMRFF